MSDPSSQSWMNASPSPSPSPAPESPAVPDRSVRLRRRVVLAAVVVAAMLVGAAAATTVFLVFDRDGQPQHRYRVVVFLETDVTAEQRGAAESALRALDPVDGVHFETREEAWKTFTETFKDRPDLINSTRPEYLPESFWMITAGRKFDCAALEPVLRLPGVDQSTVVQLPSKNANGVVVKCP